MANKTGKDAAGNSSRKYSDALRISALVQYDLTHQVKATANEFGIPDRTLSNWIKERAEAEEKKESGEVVDLMGVTDAPERMALVKKELIQSTIPIMRKALKVINDKLEQCSAPQAATVYGILHDKVALMEGTLPGQGGGNVTINNNTYISQIPDQEAEKLMRRAAERLNKKKAIEADYEVIPDQNNDGDNSGEPE